MPINFANPITKFLDINLKLSYFCFYNMITLKIQTIKVWINVLNSSQKYHITKEEVQFYFEFKNNNCPDDWNVVILIKTGTSTCQKKFHSIMTFQNFLLWISIRKNREKRNSNVDTFLSWYIFLSLPLVLYSLYITIRMDFLLSPTKKTFYQLSLMNCLEGMY